MGRRVSGKSFRLVGVPAQLGRAFVPDDDRPGTHVVLLSHSSGSGASAQILAVIGRALSLNGESYTVMEVMPRLLFPVPRFFKPEGSTLGAIAFRRRKRRSVAIISSVVARVKPGVTQKQAEAEMETIAARLARQYPD